MSNKSDTGLFFVVGCARSGTTSLCRILNEAKNAVCLLEPMPNLNREIRDFIEGRFSKPYRLMVDTVIQRAADTLDEGITHYGEKNVNLGPFIPYLYELSKCRFVYVHRDGRDVVRSLINWHNQMFGNIYRECKEIGNLSDRAKKAQEQLPIDKDESDYSRPRPTSDDIWYERWDSFTRLEMCAWYWSRINDLYLKNFQMIPPENWISIDYTNPSAKDIELLVSFLNLEGPNADIIEPMLERRINSLKDRIEEDDLFPKWPEWSHIDRVRFENIATGTMKRLGYYPLEHIRYCPPMYGQWWNTHDGGLEWYKWMYESRLAAHKDFIEFLRILESRGESVRSLLDVGCGMGVGYAEEFADKRYVGMDLSKKAIEWCRLNRRNPNHEYLYGDIIRSKPKEKFDVVFSQGTIDNSYDMDAMLKAMVASSNRWIYVTAYRGWFPDLPEHRYTWDENTTCFYNDLSPAEITRTLKECGCVDIQVTPLDVGIREGNPIRYETRIIARVR